MRQETIINVNGETRQVTLRGLTQNEIKGLSDNGFTTFGPQLNMDNADAGINSALALVLPEEDLRFLGDCENRYTRQVWMSLTKETWGNLEEEKNSDATTRGTSTESE